MDGANWQPWPGVVEIRLGGAVEPNQQRNTTARR